MASKAPIVPSELVRLALLGATRLLPPTLRTHLQNARIAARAPEIVVFVCVWMDLLDLRVKE